MTEMEADPRDRYFDLIARKDANVKDFFEILSALNENGGPDWMISHMEALMRVPREQLEWKKRVVELGILGIIPTVTEDEALDLLNSRAALSIPNLETDDRWNHIVKLVRENRDTPARLIADYFNEYLTRVYVMSEVTEGSEASFYDLLEKTFEPEPFVVKTFAERFGTEKVARCLTDSSMPVIERLDALAAEMNDLCAKRQLPLNRVKEIINEASVLTRRCKVEF